jgi:hypothetical protein
MPLFINILIKINYLSDKNKGVFTLFDMLTEIYISNPHKMLP